MKLFIQIKIKCNGCCVSNARFNRNLCATLCSIVWFFDIKLSDFAADLKLQSRYFLMAFDLKYTFISNANALGNSHFREQALTFFPHLAAMELMMRVNTNAIFYNQNWNINSSWTSLDTFQCEYTWKWNWYLSEFFFGFARSHSG